MVTEPKETDREADLAVELWRQWEYNHSEHCGGVLPHSEDEECYWPLPDALNPV